MGNYLLNAKIKIKDKAQTLAKIKFFFDVYLSLIAHTALKYYADRKNIALIISLSSITIAVASTQWYLLAYKKIEN